MVHCEPFSRLPRVHFPSTQCYLPSSLKVWPLSSLVCFCVIQKKICLEVLHDPDTSAELKVN